MEETTTQESAPAQQKSKKMLWIILGIIALAALGVGFVMLGGNSATNENTSITPTEQPTATSVPETPTPEVSPTVSKVSPTKAPTATKAPTPTSGDLQANPTNTPAPTQGLPLSN